MPPGQAAAPVPIQADEFSRLATLAARQAAASAALGRLPSSDRELPGAVVWEDAGSAVAVGLADLTVAVAEGTVAVTVPVWCDQLPDQEGQVVVVFEVGAPGRPVGLLAATAAQPQGDPLVVRLWGEQLIALAWQALLDTAAGVARSSGVDADGTPLAATALSASKDGVEVLPQARHPFDRVSTGRAVVP